MKRSTKRILHNAAVLYLLLGIGGLLTALNAAAWGATEDFVAKVFSGSLAAIIICGPICPATTVYSEDNDFWFITRSPYESTGDADG